MPAQDPVQNFFEELKEGLPILLAFGTPVDGQDPPQADRIELALSDPAFDWHELETENFRVYYLIQSLTPAGAEYAGRDLENSLEHNLGLLQEQHDPDPIRALFVGSRDEMAQVVGRSYGGIALPDERAVVFISTGDGRSATKHELMHLVAYEVWGRPREPHQWISEGLATFSPGRCAEFTLASLAALMADTGELPSLDTLVNRFYSVSDVYTYLAGASFVEYVHGQYGASAVRALWSNGWIGGAESLGMTAEVLEQAWRVSISKVAPAPSSAWDRIRSVGCEGP